jgi:hypothetical protein
MKQTLFAPHASGIKISPLTHHKRYIAGFPLDPSSTEAYQECDNSGKADGLVASSPEVVWGYRAMLVAEDPGETLLNSGPESSLVEWYAYAQVDHYMPANEYSVLGVVP